MKNEWFYVAVAALAVLALMVFTRDHPASLTTPVQTVTQAYSLLPGQKLTVTNRDFKNVHVRSQFPIQMISGGCSNTYTVDWTCQNGPHDLFIIDTRRMPFFATPQANAISVDWN